MALVIPPGFAQVVLRYSLTGDPEEMVTTWGIDVAGNGEAEANAIGVEHVNQFPAVNILTGWTFVGVTLRVGQDGAPPAVVENLVGTVGSASASGLPNNCAFLLSKQTSRGGRQGRGRCYWPVFVVSEGMVSQNGMIEPVSRGVLNGAFSSVVFTADPYLFHDEASPGSVAPDAITSVSLQSQIATQRRRMRS